MSESQPCLVQLRRRLERLEPARGAGTARLCALGHDDIDAALGGGLARGRLHEIFADEEDAGSAAGLAGLFCLRMSGPERGPVLWLRTEGAERRAGMLHATGLGELGFDPRTVFLVLVPDERALLHAAAEATRCAGLSAMLVECRGAMPGLDLTTTRRLMLAAEASGIAVFLLRIAGDPGPSAADTRWRVTPAPSAALEAEAPGAPMFDLELLRRRAGHPAGPWRMEWDRDRMCFRQPLAHAIRDADAPLSGIGVSMAARGTMAQDDAQRHGAQQHGARRRSTG